MASGLCNHRCQFSSSGARRCRTISTEQHVGIAIFTDLSAWLLGMDFSCITYWHCTCRAGLPHIVKLFHLVPVYAPWNRRYRSSSSDSQCIRSHDLVTSLSPSWAACQNQSHLSTMPSIVQCSTHGDMLYTAPESGSGADGGSETGTKRFLSLPRTTDVPYQLISTRLYISR